MTKDEENALKMVAERGISAFFSPDYSKLAYNMTSHGGCIEDSTIFACLVGSTQERFDEANNFVKGLCKGKADLYDRLQNQ